MRLSLRVKIVTFAVALSLLPMLLLSLALLGISYNAQRNEVLKRQQETAQQLSAQIQSTLIEIQHGLEVVGRTSDWQALDATERNLLIDTLYRYRTLALLGGGFGAFDEVLLLDGLGQPVAGHSTSRLMSLRAWADEVRAAAFDVVMSDGVYQGGVYISAAQVPTLDLAVPARDLPGRITGLFWGSVNLDRALWPVISGPGVPEGMFVYLVDRQGYLIARNDRHFIGRDDPLSDALPVQQMAQGAMQGISTYTGLTGEGVVGAWQPVGDLEWAVVVETPTDVAFADVRRLLTPAVALSLATIAAAVGAGVLAAQLLVRPVETLRTGAEIIGRGQLDHRIQIRSQDELGALARAFNEMASSLKNSHDQLEHWALELEVKVQERTRELAAASERMRRRALQLQTAAEVASAISSLQQVETLLSQVTRLISERFGWYHVGIFLVDEPGEYAVLQAANSEGGQRMLDRGHRLEVGEMGIVGRVTKAGKPRIAVDVGLDAVYFGNPDLPQTRSEMALPLIVGDDIIGALDVQSRQASAFDDEDVALLGTLADQVAIAIHNARLYEQAQRALEEVSALHRQYVRREWAQLVADRRDLAYEYRRMGTPTLAEHTPPEMAMALDRGEVVAMPDLAAAAPRDAAEPSSGDGRDGHDGAPARAGLAAPIKLREEVIGVLDLQEADHPREWTEDEIALVEAVSDQLALALENARLFTDAQRRAEQMSTLHRIGMSLTAGLRLDRVLQALYEQCRQVLVADTFYVALYDEDTGLIEFPLLTGVDGAIEVEPLNIRHQPGITGYIIRSGRPLYVPDTHSVPADAPYRAIPLTQQPNRSYIGIPLTSRGRVVGVLSVQGRQPHAYSQDDVDLLRTIAAQASIAIENARAYEQLQSTAEKLREVDRLKTQFLANMSHELRTPLNSIIGFSRVMLKGIDGPITDLQEADLTSIYESGQHLLRLITDILDMSKINAGKMELSFGEVELGDIFETALGTAEAFVKSTPVRLRKSIEADVPTVWADAQRVRQVVLNLLSNAARFTEEGQITLQAWSEGDFVTISVSDTGIGIPPEGQAGLFEPFLQVDASTTRRAGGTGLGLAISRSFVEMHGGEMWVESQPGEGSTFYFSLPVYRAVESQVFMADELDLDPDKELVLVVDDDPGVVTLFSRYVVGSRFQVAGVTHSEEALPRARQFKPHLLAVILDLMMPQRDGWQILADLKADPELADIPVVVASILHVPERSREMGAVEYLLKPVAREELLDVLNRLSAPDSASRLQA
jgi:signal transduction histidine kinase/HAMP domain-containing protein/ActR/RegA family two-component response regulator